MKLFGRPQKTDQSEMSFVEHLEDLRKHLIRIFLAILVSAGIVFIYRDWVFDNILAGPINPNFLTYKYLCQFSHWVGAGDALCMPPVQVEMQVITFGGQFLSSISMALILGVIFVSPYIFWELWNFTRPALKEKEIKYSRFIIFWVSFFFLLGAAFGYFLLGPFTFNFLANFKLGNTGMLITRPTLTDYLDNLTNLILGCGLAFELPVLSYVLTKIGILTPMFLKKYRKYAIVFILILAALITPSPDWMSQIIVFLPLWILYEISIMVSSKIYKEEEKEWS